MAGLHIPFPEESLSPDNANVAEELRIQRWITEQFIETEPVDISLVPRTKTRTPDGGTKRLPATPKAAQRFKVVMISPAGGSIEQRSTNGGGERRVDLVLIGKWDADVSIGDYWDDETGQRNEVTSIIPFNGYEVRANVRSYGREPLHG